MDYYAVGQCTPGIIERKLLALPNSAELDKEEDARLMGLPALRACLGSQRVRISERIFCPARQKFAAILTDCKDF